MPFTDLENFLKTGRAGQRDSRHASPLADIETPLSAYRKIRGAGESFLFESVEGGEQSRALFVVGCNPRAVIKQTGNRV